MQHKYNEWGDYMDGIKIIDEKYVFLGSYPQNGTVKEPIKWRIIKSEDNILTLITDTILFNDDFDIHYSDYERSKIRKIIHEDFIPYAFTEEELSCILETQLEGFNDKVYIPSLEEVKGISREERIRKVTPYAVSKKASSYPAFTKKEKVLEGNGWYWLRTPYKPPYDPHRPNHVYYISYSGSIEERNVWGYDIGVVLMIRIKI